MSICSLCLVDEDLFLNFLSSSYSLVIGIKTKLLKRGAKDATRMARSMQEHGSNIEGRKTGFLQPSNYNTAELYAVSRM